jgi:hypothetical protein
MLQVLLKKLTRELVMLSVFYLPADRKRAIERRLRGREELRKLGLADVVVVSFGKSGRTWLRVMLSRFYQLRFKLKDSAFIGFDNLNRKHQGIPRVFFTHDNYLRDYTGHGDTREDFYKKKVVLMVRHPADVAVSQFHQWKFRMRPAKKSLNLYPQHGAEISIHDFVKDENSGLGKVIEFMNAWASELSKVRELMVVRYEDLRADTGHELRRVLEFMGADPSDDEIADAVSFASVENMRALEEKKVFWLSGSRMLAKDKSNPDSYKVRRAKVGGWRDYFDEAQAAGIEAEIERRLLPAFGYLASERKATQPVAAAE